MEGRTGWLIVGGVAAGCGSAMLGCVLLPTLWLLPGLLFAACVVVPWARMCGWPSDRVWGIAVLCGVGYAVAHAVAAATQFVAAPAGAAVGTAIMLAPAFSDPKPPVRRAAWRGLAVGVVAAVVFTAFAFVPEGWWGLLLGIVVWQVAVAAALAPAVEQRSAAEPVKAGTDDGLCPHCGAPLPPVRDAYCPECRESLS